MATDIDDLLGKLRQFPDVTVEKEGGGHYKVRRNGAMVTMPSTPSDRRSLQNTYAELRRTLHLDVRFQHGPRKKLKTSIDDEAMKRLRARIETQLARLSPTDFVRLALLVQSEKNLPGWGSVKAGGKALAEIRRSHLRVKKTTHNTLCAVLNYAESSSDAVLERKLAEWSEAQGARRFTHVKTDEEKPPPQVVSVVAEPEPVEPTPGVLRVEIGLDPETRALLRDLVATLRREV